MLGAILVLGGGAARASAPRSARVCSSCHGPIKKQWETSAMSRSWTSPVFQAFLADAKAALGDSVQASCVACHAPLAAVAGDSQVSEPISQEGVTCNFCHNVSAVDVSPRPASYTWDASDPNLMRGPSADSDPGSAHKAAHSELLTKGEFCSSCHYYGDPAAGLQFEGTYPEWKASKAAASGIQCQDCHMPPSPGKSAIISKQTRDRVNAHTFPGAHTSGVLDSTATLAAAVESGKLRLTVTNARGGHSLPGGGASMRAITLDVVYFNGAGAELSRTQVESFGTQFADAAGRSPVPKWLAKKTVRSKQIPADEPAVEWAAIPAGAKRAEAALTYHYILPSYRAGLEARKVDLSAYAPVVMARASVALP